MEILHRAWMPCNAFARLSGLYDPIFINPVPFDLYGDSMDERRAAYVTTGLGIRNRYRTVKRYAKIAAAIIIPVYIAYSCGFCSPEPELDEEGIEKIVAEDD